MKLTEAISGHALAGAERRSGSISVSIQRSRSGYHLTRTTPDPEGCAVAQSWPFPNLYELFVFAREQGFAEVDLEATDWGAVPE